MLTFLFVMILLLSLSITGFCYIKDEDSRALLVSIVTLIIILLSFIFSANVPNEKWYKQGQVDALNGLQHYQKDTVTTVDYNKIIK